MTAFDYTRSQATADRLIARFGQAGKLRRQTKTGPAHNPTISTTDYDATFAVIDFTNREIDGTRVLATDKKVLLKAGGLGIFPTTEDQIVIGGVVHSIIRTATVAPAGAVVLYELQCRR